MKDAGACSGEYRKFCRRHKRGIDFRKLKTTDYPILLENINWLIGSMGYSNAWDYVKAEQREIVMKGQAILPRQIVDMFADYVKVNGLRRW